LRKWLAKPIISKGERLVKLGVDIHADNEGAFRWSCANGHIKIAKWLISLGNIPNECINEYFNTLKKLK
jgi:ankyrin repeat protein